MSASRCGLQVYKAGVTLTTLLTAAVFGVIHPTAARADTGLETFVMATNGQSNFSTYGAPNAVFTNFGVFGGSVPSNAASDPSVLASTGVSGTYRVTNSNSAAVLTDALSTAGTDTSGFGAWSYTGSTGVTARYGQLKSTSQAVHTGNSDNGTVNNAESYGIFKETFNVTGAGVTNGSAGTMRIAVTIDGSLSVVGKGTAGLLLRYAHGSNPVFNNSAGFLLETFADIYGNGYQIYGPHSSYGSFTAPPGMSYNVGPLDSTGSPASITFGGAATVYATVPILFGVTTNYHMGMLTFTNVGNGDGTLNSSFDNTATISGIQLFDAAGNQVNDFAITSGSGTSYDANGVRLSGSANAPEPSALALLASALPLAALALRRKPRL